MLWSRYQRKEEEKDAPGPGQYRPASQPEKAGKEAAAWSFTHAATGREVCLHSWSCLADMHIHEQGSRSAANTICECYSCCCAVLQTSCTLSLTTFGFRLYAMSLMLVIPCWLLLVAAVNVCQCMLTWAGCVFASCKSWHLQVCSKANCKELLQLHATLQHEFVCCENLVHIIRCIVKGMSVMDNVC